MSVNYISKTDKQIHRKRDQICGYEKWGLEGGGIRWRQSRGKTFGYKINKY